MVAGLARLVPVGVLVMLAGGGGCAPAGTRTVTLASLEAAPERPLIAPERHLVGNAAALRDLCTPLGPRLGLLQVRSPRDWKLLNDVVPQTGPCPDLDRGTIIGIACWAGTPVDGSWPVDLDTIQVRAGGGLLRARFAGGSYLPDGTARLETDYVEGLRSVLVVDVNGMPFYPE